MPSDHLLRKIDSVIDFPYIYEIVEDLYCKDNGRPSVDPVVIFKMVLIQHLYGIASLRRTVEEIKMNVAYRWLLGYLMNEEIPHFSTISYNFKHRYTEKTIENVFYWILNEIEEACYLSSETVFIDGTHIKANANIRKVVKKAVPQAEKRLDLSGKEKTMQFSTKVTAAKKTTFSYERHTKTTWGSIVIAQKNF